jgi:hypothetical protein
MYLTLDVGANPVKFRIICGRLLLPNVYAYLTHISSDIAHLKFPSKKLNLILKKLWYKNIADNHPVSC